MDLSQPIEIADRLWWVGSLLPDDRFQCHSYLLEHGDQSVLFDPGSVLTIRDTLRKIERVARFGNIRYFVCHHQDPDIAGAMPLIDQILHREDAVLVTHWRAAVLLKHLGLKLPMWEISAHDWRLDLGGRELEFVFTPYLHFPGAFTTFDRATGTLLSSDLFGGFTDGTELFADSLAVFDGIRAFHEHYMPSREVLLSGMLRLERLPLETIAPQHGQILRRPLIAPIVERLKGLECGLYLLTDRDSRVERLLALNEALRAMLRSLHLERELSTVAGHLSRLLQPVLPVQSLEFLVPREDQGFELLGPSNRYRGAVVEVPEALRAPFGLGRAEVVASLGAAVFVVAPAPRWPVAALGADALVAERAALLVLPVHGAETDRVEMLALLGVGQEVVVDKELERVLLELASPMGAAVERELLLRRMQVERDEIQAAAARDPLTELYTRRYLNEVLTRIVPLHDRSASACFAVLMLDIDHFKQVNDTYGHPGGDAVLRGVAEVIRGTVRVSDIAVRFGGEEVLILADLGTTRDALALAERIRTRVENTAHELEGAVFRVTLSVGLSVHVRGEPFTATLARADAALYRAKNAGRNRVEAAGEPA